MGLENGMGYNIVSDRELASVLDNFSPETVQNILDDILTKKGLPSLLSMGNIVTAYEESFKACLSSYVDNRDLLMNARHETYVAIIDKVCRYHNISYDLSEATDIYSIASLIYGLLVSGFYDNIVGFFVNYIFKEKNNIYDMMNLAEFKKNKDSSATYSKKIYKSANNKLAIIHANMDYVITNLSSYDISFNQFVDIAYSNNKGVSSFLLNVLSDNDNFFTSFVLPIINGPNRPEIITSIRLQLQPAVAASIEQFVED